MTPVNRSSPGSGRTPAHEREYCHKAAIRIMHLVKPARNLSVSRLMLMKASQLEEIGKAARNLYEALERSGLAK